MKKILLIIMLLACLVSKAQHHVNYDGGVAVTELYDTVLQIGTVKFNAHVLMPYNYWVTRKKRQGFLFLPGKDENTTTVSKVYWHGPGSFMFGGRNNMGSAAVGSYNGGVVVSNNIDYPIYIMLQPPRYSYPTEGVTGLKAFINLCWQIWDIPAGSRHLTGLSNGGLSCAKIIAGSKTDSTLAAPEGISSVVIMNPQVGGIPAANFGKFIRQGGQLLVFRNEGDGNGPEFKNIVTYCNNINDGSAHYIQTTWPGGGTTHHTGWNEDYDSSRNVWNIGSNSVNYINGEPVNMNVYQFMLRAGDTTLGRGVTANAGADQTRTLPTSSTTLTGTASTGNITSYLWTKQSGPSVTITSPTSASTTVTGLSAGTYVFRITVSDGTNSNYDEMTLTVNAQPASIIANAGTDTLVWKNQIRPDTVFLRGRAMGGTPSTIAWSLISKPSGAATPTMTAASALQNIVKGNFSEGYYTYRLTLDGTATDDVTFRVRNYQTKNETPCRSGTKQVFTLTANSNKDADYSYINRDNKFGAQVMGGDTIRLLDSMRYVKIGDVGGSDGCPVTIAPSVNGQTVFKQGGYLWIAAGADSNNVVYAKVDGKANYSSKGVWYGFKWDNRAGNPNGYQSFLVGMASNVETNNLEMHSVETPQFKFEPRVYDFARYDKMTCKRMSFHDWFIDTCSGELYVGHTLAAGGQKNNSYGPPPRGDTCSVYNIIMIHGNLDHHQLSDLRWQAKLYNNFSWDYATSSTYNQDWGMLFGGNCQGDAYKNIVINGSGGNMGVLGYGDVKVYQNFLFGSGYIRDDSSSTVDGLYSLYASGGNTVKPEDNTQNPLRLSVDSNIIAHVNSKAIFSANNGGYQIPGHIKNNFLFDSTKTASQLIATNAADTIAGNVVKGLGMDLSVVDVSATSAGASITLLLNGEIKTFNNPATLIEDARQWLFNKLLSGAVTPAANSLLIRKKGFQKVKVIMR